MTCLNEGDLLLTIVERYDNCVKCKKKNCNKNLSNLKSISNLIEIQRRWVKKN